MGGSYYVDDHFLIPINFNDFITDGVENYHSAGGTVNVKIFDASTETVYHGIIDARVFPISQVIVSDLNITGDGLIAGEPYACPETSSPYFDAYAGGGNLDLCGKGDVNMSGTIDGLDIVIIANYIIGIQPPLPNLEYLADMNRDDDINVLDVMEIVFIILGQ